MRFLLVAVLFSSVSLALAQPQFSLPRSGPALPAPAALLGTWGSEAQCDAFAADGSDNPALMPYEISADWIRQGFLYCALSWQGETRIDGEPRYFADASCGEDDLRDYRLTLELRDRRLRIRWSDDFTTTALEAC